MNLQPSFVQWTLFLAALSALPALAIDMCLPALTAMSGSLAMSDERAQMVLSLFLLGFAIGQPLYGVLSDAYGRRLMLLLGIGLFALGGLAATWSTSGSVLLAARLVQGLGACAGAVLSIAIVRDAMTGKAAARLLSAVTVVMTFAPMIAPTLGAGLLFAASWRAIFGVLGTGGAVLWLWIALKYRETLSHPDPSALDPVIFVRNLYEVVTTPVTLFGMLTVALMFAGMFAYISSSPFVLMRDYALGPGEYSLAFGATAACIMAGGTLSGSMLSAHGVVRTLRRGLNITLPAVLFGAAIALLPHRPSLWLVLSAVGAFNFSLGFLSPLAVTVAMAPMQRSAGLASALIGCVEMLAGSASSWMLGALLGVGWSSMLGTMAACGGSAILAGQLALRDRRTRVAA